MKEKKDKRAALFVALRCWRCCSDDSTWPSPAHEMICRLLPGTNLTQYTLSMWPCNAGNGG